MNPGVAPVVAAIAPPAAGWQAHLRLGLRPGAGRTVLAERSRSGPLAVQRPFYPEGEVCHVYLLHPPGGVVGGDSLDIDVKLECNAHALLTTPGATKFYRSAGACARQTQLLRVADGADLEWLPQENIFFPGARVATRTRVDLYGNARIALWEMHCLGRPSNHEGFESGSIDSRLEIYRDDRPLLLERLRVDARTRVHLALMAGLPVTATLVISHADETLVESCRDLLLSNGNECAGATLLGDLLVVRYLGHSTENARRLLTAVWALARPACLGRTAVAPRIWAT